MQKIVYFFLLLISTAVKAQDVDVLHYKFQLQLFDDRDEIEGKAELKIRFLKPLTSFNIDLVKADGQGKGMKAVVSGSNVLEATQNETAISIKLKTPTRVDSIYSFIVAYKGTPKDGLIISKNKFGDRTFFSDNWPNRAHNWIPCIDKPNDKASFEFVVTAPSRYRVISNGVLVEEKQTGNGFTVTHWKEDTPLPTKIMAIGVAKFATKTFADSPNDIPVSAWVYPQDSTKGFYDYALATGIVKFFSSYIAPFPYKKLANVQSKTIFGGMENASAIFYAETSVTGDRSKEDLLAHEIAHQWFGDMASEKSFAHLWLSEGFATYFTNLYFEKTKGKDVANKRLEKEREEIIEFVKGSGKAVVDSSKDLMSLLNANSYQKGSWVLHMLRQEVGDSSFHKIIQTYYNRYKGGNADSRDFEAIAEKVSGKELTWFFDQWLYRPGIPQLQMTAAVQNNEFFLTVKQLGKPYRFNLEIQLVAEDGETTKERFEIKNLVTELKVPIKGTSVSFSHDPDTKLLYELKK